MDERFREFVSMSLGDKTPDTKKLWDTMARGVRKNERRQREIKAASTFMPHLGMYAIEADVPTFVDAVDHITRGLYWHCYHERLPLEIQIDARLMRAGDWMERQVNDMARAIVGVDQFFYAYKRMDEHPTVSVWIYLFHRRIAGMAITDVKLADEIDAKHKAAASS